MTDEVRVVNERTGGAKGAKLARFDLLPWKAIWQVAELYGKGAEKYEERNWERGYDWSLSYAAMQRHAALLAQGEWLDAETRCPHLASVIFHALALLTFFETHPELCDLPALRKVVNEATCDSRVAEAALPTREEHRAIDADLVERIKRELNQSSQQGGPYSPNTPPYQAKWVADDSERHDMFPPTTHVKTDGKGHPLKEMS